MRLKSNADAAAAWQMIGGKPAILEGFVRFEREFSLLVARGADDSHQLWDPVHNIHIDGILAVSTVPAPDVAPAVLEAAGDLAMKIVDRLDYVGVLAIEFFDGADGPVFNEMAAARPQ